MCCRGDNSDAPSHDPFAALAAELARRGLGISFVGRRPGKEIDPLLTGRVIVIGDDADLAAVVLRLVRKELLTSVTIGYLTPGPTPFTLLWGLPVAVDALATVATDREREVTILRDDVGGVLVGSAELAPVDGTAYVDERRVLHGAVRRVRVRPNAESGLTLGVEQRRFLGLGHTWQEFEGRATSVGAAGMTVVSDGVEHRRPMDRWTYYRHQQPLRLLRPAPTED
ncbi:hypothetical protein D1871_04215 [Nakamurella silvestris]|nr:hypothetical protein D1871_04215 [Nakamurella silvestris]